MFCIKCGNKIENDSKFCEVCGENIEEKKEEEIEILDVTESIDPIIEEININESNNVEDIKEEQLEEEKKDEIIEEEPKVEYSENTLSEVSITYEDEEPEVVDAPVIIESHTFIDDNNALKSKIDEKLNNTEKNNKKRNKLILLSSIVGVILLLVLILTITLVLSKKGLSIVNKRVSINESSITIDGYVYNMNDKYTKFKEHGWYLVDEELELNKKEKSSIVDLLNSKYSDNKMTVSIINETNEIRKHRECNVWSIKINNHNKEDKIDFVLPGGIKNGSTGEQIMEKYGDLSDEEIYRSDALGYTKYHYKDELKSYLELYVYDNEGLQGFTYMNY